MGAKQMNRIGPQMMAAATIVADHPGCCKKFVAERISPCPYPDKNWSLGYEPVHRAIKAGLIQAERLPNGRYRLHPKQSETR